MSIKKKKRSSQSLDTGDVQQKRCVIKSGSRNVSFGGEDSIEAEKRRDGRGEKRVSSPRECSRFEVFGPDTWRDK